MCKVEVKNISPSARFNVLAQSTDTLFDCDSFVPISDVGVLQNRQDQRWVAVSSHPPQGGGKTFSYEPTAELTHTLARELTSKVQTVFEVWTASGGGQ